MDQLKQVFAALKKHHFWILCGLVAVVCAVGYVLARLSLSKLIETRVTTIEQDFTTVKGVQSESATHPNPSTHTEMDRIIKNLSDDVKISWEMQYNKQSKIFVWPEDALDPEKKEQTLKVLRGLLPIETKLAFPVVEPQPLINTERNIYRDYIDKRFPQLAQIIDAEWTAKMRTVAGGGMMGMGGMGMMGMGGGGGKGMGAPGGGMEMGTETGSDASYGMMGTESSAMVRRPANAKPPTVNWSHASQQQLMDSICSWYNPSRPPNTLQICYTQEDLWILEGILRIIAATNDGARANFQAPIKEIEFIRFGAAAMNQSGSVIMQADVAAAPAGGMGMGGMNEVESMMPGKGGAPAFGMEGEGSAGMGMGTGMGMELDPADNRYVDTQFKPIAAADLRTKMASSDPADAPFVVAKRIPVRLRFSKMDQRKLNKLIAECGNTGTPENPRLVLEVRQVRVNGAAVSTSGMGMGGMGMGGMGMGGMGMETGSSMGGGGKGMGAPGGMEGSSSDGYGMEMGSAGMGMGMGGSAPKSGFDVPIEIYGIIYLYNPVDMEKLGLANVTANTNLEAGSEAPPADPNAAANPAAAVPANPAVANPAAANPAAANPAVPNPTAPNDNAIPSGAPNNSEGAANNGVPPAAGNN